MADFNLEAMSLKELRQLQKDHAKAISSYEHRHKAGARSKLEAIAKEMGYSIAELIGDEVKTNRVKTNRAPTARNTVTLRTRLLRGLVVVGNRIGSSITSMRAKTQETSRSDRASASELALRPEGWQGWRAG